MQATLPAQAKPAPAIARRSYKVSEVAQMIGRNPVTVYRLLYSGGLKVLPTPGRLSIPASEVERLLGAEPVRYSPIKRNRKAKAATGLN